MCLCDKNQNLTRWLKYFAVHWHGLDTDAYQKLNKTNLTNLYPPTKGYLRETCKSQNINPIYLALSSPSVSFRS